MPTTLSVRDLVRRLPKPNAIYALPGVTFELYRAKDVANPRWSHPTLRALTIRARASYDVYGKRPRLDEYDAKSAIYLVRCLYTVRGKYGRAVATEVWMSNRFVPNAGKPLGAAEIDLYVYKKRNLEKVVQQLFFKGDRAFREHILSYSRMCSVPPYAVRAGDDALLNDVDRVRNPYVNICFSLICYQFIRDHDALLETMRCITGLIRDDLVDHALTFRKNGVAFKPAFTPAHRFLHLPGKRAIRLDRTVYTYEFPGYFLLLSSLCHTLQRLVASGKLTPKTIEYYLGGDIVELCARWNKRDFTDMNRLGKLLNTKGTIRFSQLTGAVLRAILDKEVPDGPELKMTDIKRWITSIDEFVHAAGIREMR